MFGAYSKYRTLSHEYTALLASLAQQERDIQNMQLLLDKLNTEEGIEIEARRRLNVQRPGEEVLIIAEKDNVLISADYNQIEMRILADLADVKELKKAFKNNEDIHSLTASQIFNIDIKKVDKDQRRKAKAINFGIIYGISQYGLAKQINVSNYEAEEFLNAYFAKFPEIKIEPVFIYPY